MGVYRHLLGDQVSVVVFRNLYSIPANVEVRPDGRDDGFVYHDGWMTFWLVTVVEAGVRFPLHPLLRGLSLGVESMPLPTATQWIQDHHGGSAVEQDPWDQPRCPGHRGHI